MSPLLSFGKIVAIVDAEGRRADEAADERIVFRISLLHSLRKRRSGNGEQTLERRRPASVEREIGRSRGECVCPRNATRSWSELFPYFSSLLKFFVYVRECVYASVCVKSRMCVSV